MAFKEYDCGPSFSPTMSSLCTHPCRVIRRQSKRTNKPREPFANHSRTDRERFANDAEYFRDRVRFQHKPKNFRTFILTENCRFLIVRRRTSVCYCVCCFLFFLCGLVDEFSRLDSPWGHLPSKTSVVMYASVLRRGIIEAMVPIHRGTLAAVSSARSDAHPITQGFHTSHGCIRSGAQSRDEMLTSTTEGYHPTYRGALARCDAHLYYARIIRLIAVGHFPGYQM